MWEKLEQIARRCAEIGELLTVPEIYGDAKELRRLTQEQKELEPVAQCYEDYRRAERTIAALRCRAARHGAGGAAAGEGGQGAAL